MRAAACAKERERREQQLQCVMRQLAEWERRELEHEARLAEQEAARRRQEMVDTIARNLRHILGPRPHGQGGESEQTDAVLRLQAKGLAMSFCLEVVICVFLPRPPPPPAASPLVF